MNPSSGVGPTRSCLLNNLRLMHNMGETIVAIDNIPRYHIVRIGCPRNSMIAPRCIFAVCDHLARWDDVNNLSGILTLTLLYCYDITEVMLPFIHWSEESGELLHIVCIKSIVFIDALSISDGFNDWDALIRFKCNDPQAQKRLWLNHIDRAPH